MALPALFTRFRPAPLGSLRANLRHCTFDGMLATPWVFVSLPGNFLLAMLLVDRFGLDKATYGWVAAFPFWANFLQLFILPFLARFLDGRELALSMIWFNVGLWLTFVGVLPFVPVGQPDAVRELIIFFFAGISLSGSFATVGWTSWTKDWMPDRVQGRYFGRRNRLMNVSSVAYLTLVAIIALNEHATIRHFQWLIGLAVIARMGSALWVHTIHTGEKLGKLNAAPVWESVRQLKGESAFWRFVAFAAWVGFWQSFIGPFQPLYIYDFLGGNVFTLACLTIIATLMGAFAMPIVSKLTDRHGARPVIMLSLILWQGQNYLWTLLTPETRWLLYPMWAWGGTVSVGYLLGIFLLLMKLVPTHAKAAAISLHLAVTSLASAVGPVLAGWILAQDWGIPEVTLYRGGFALAFTSILLGILILAPIREPKVQGEASMMGTMRSLRQLMAYSGVTSFLNVHLARKPTKR